MCFSLVLFVVEGRLRVNDSISWDVRLPDYRQRSFKTGVNTWKKTAKHTSEWLVLDCWYHCRGLVSLTPGWMDQWVRLFRREVPILQFVSQVILGHGRLDAVKLGQSNIQNIVGGHHNCFFWNQLLTLCWSNKWKHSHNFFINSVHFLRVNVLL